MTPAATSDDPARDPVVAALVALGAMAAATAGAAPTGRTLVDVALAAVLGGVVVVASARGGDVSRTWLASIAAVAGTIGGGAAAVLGLVAVAVHLGGLVRPPTPHEHRLAAVVGVLSVAALVRLDGGPDLLSAAVAAAAVVPVLLSAARTLSPSHTTTVRRAILGVAVVVGVVAVGGVVAAALASIALDDGLRQVRAGLESARAGDRDAAVTQLTAAHAAFEDAEGATEAPWAVAARLVPVVAPQLDALEQLGSAGSGVTSAAGEAAEVAAVGDLTLQDGAVDLGTIAALRDPLGRTADAVADARAQLDGVDGPWLGGPLGDQLDRYQDDLAGAAHELDLVGDVLDVAPGLLGGEGPRRYLVLVGSPAEARELGGFVGNWVELEATDGRLTLTDDGRSGGDLNDLLEASGVALDPAIHPSRLVAYEPGRFWQNITGSPDFPTVARAAAELYGGATGRSVDGVLYVDPIALAGLLRLTGPVRVEGVGRPLNPQNVADFLLEDQYVDVPEKAERIDLLGQVATAVFDQLTRSSFPAPREVIRALGPATDEDRLLLWTTDADERAVFAELGLDGAFEPPDGNDSVALVTANAGPSKLDTYLQRELAYEVDVEPTSGTATATATVRLTNDAPVPRLPDYVLGDPHGGPPGTNHTMVSLYSPLQVVEADVGGFPVAPETLPELGRWRHSLFVSVPPGQTVELRLSLAGTLAAPNGYALALDAQPLVAPDAFSIVVRRGGDVVLERSWEGSHDERVTVPSPGDREDANSRP